MPYSSHALKSYKVMSYNVENLFDTLHDQGKKDFTFVPFSHPDKKKECLKIKYKRYQKECLETDWSSKHLDLKLLKIKEVLSKSGLPHFLGLSEVENKNVLGKLSKKLGYDQFVITESPDHRGVDVALLFKSSADYKMISQKELVVTGEYFNKRPTRNILEVAFEFKNADKTLVYFYVNHWPSLGNPTQTRLRAAQTLKDRVLELQKKKPRAHFIAMGDFNTIDENHPHPFKDVLLKETSFKELHEAFYESSKVTRTQKRSLPPGSYFYAKKMQWNRLDRFFISQKFLDKFVDVSSYRIVNDPYLTGVYEYSNKSDPLYGSRILGIPKKYDHQSLKEKKAGYSDHFPIIFEFKI